MSKDVHKNNLERLNVFLEKFTEKYGFVLLLVGISLIILLPIAIALGVTFLPFVSAIYGTSNAWIGFWGSFMGGILGTIGIIFVAYLQNNLQREQNQQVIDNQEMSAERMETYERERLNIQTKLGLLKDYKKSLSSFKNEIQYYSNLYKKWAKIVFEYSLHNKGSYWDNAKNREFESIRNEFNNIDYDHFYMLYSSIENDNELLASLTSVDLKSFKEDDSTKFVELDEASSDIKHLSIDSASKEYDINNSDTHQKTRIFFNALFFISREEFNILDAQKKLIDYLDGINNTK